MKILYNESSHYLEVNTLENIKDCYSLKDVCEELYISRDISYKSERDQIRKNFEDFLFRISVPVDCFKNDSNEWCFNEDGKELLLDFCTLQKTATLSIEICVKK